MPRRIANSRPPDPVSGVDDSSTRIESSSLLRPPSPRRPLMTARASDNSSATTRLIERAVGGEQAPLGELLERHRSRLRRMVAIRMDARLQGRLDPSDVIQEAFLEAAVRLHEYGRDPTMPFFLWLRLITGQQLMILHRRHLKTQARAAGREVSLQRGAMPEASAPRSPPSSSAMKRARAKPSTGPSGRSISRPPSTRWTRSTARSSRCGISSD